MRTLVFYQFQNNFRFEKYTGTTRLRRLKEEHPTINFFYEEMIEW